jgi:signal transduction histidine kinase
VRDDGRGFAPEAAQKRDSFGLFGIAERVGQLNGTLSIRSARSEGTSIDVKLPAMTRVDMESTRSNAILS